MKKLLSLITAFGIMFYALQSCNNCPPCNQGSVTKADSTAVQCDTMVSDTVHTNQWYITVIVKGSKAAVVSDATVTLRCAGGTRNTGAEGAVTFTGTGPCPCLESGCKAYINKPGECTNVEVPINRGCNQVYSGYCN
jgi:hypothetical protein